MTREEIRKHFTDFRYCPSTAEPHILREFVRFEEVVKLIEFLENEKINRKNK